MRPDDFRLGLERFFRLSEPPAADWKLVGAESCSRDGCDLSRAVVTGPGTVTIRLTEQNPRLMLLLLAAIPAPPGTPLHAVRRGPPGTGPYRVESFVPHRELTFVRNTHFRVWSAAARPDGYPDEIVWRLDASAGEAVDAVARDEADVLLAGAPAKRLPGLKARYAGRLRFVPQTATTFMFLNVRRPPFDDVRVRRALNFAVDRAKMAELHGVDLAVPTCQVIPPNLPGYRRYCPYTIGEVGSGVWKAPDIARARRLIAASGTRGQEVTVWTFPFFGGEGRYAVALLRELGYRASLHVVRDLPAYFEQITAKPPQVGFAGWFGMQLPADVFEPLACDFAANWARFCDPRIDREVRRLVDEQTTDLAAALPLAARIDREVVDAAPWVPLFTPRDVDFVSSRVGNYQSNPYNGILLDQLWVR